MADLPRGLYEDLLTEALQGKIHALEDPGAQVSPDRPIEPATVLRAVELRMPDGAPENIHAPLIPLLDTAHLAGKRALAGRLCGGYPARPCRSASPSVTTTSASSARRGSSMSTSRT